MITPNSKSNDRISSNIPHETEDGEIEDIGGNFCESSSNDKEIGEYYKLLESLGNQFRCPCCSTVFSDPVKLQCSHLMDRNCIVNIFKKNKDKKNSIVCTLCKMDTICNDIDKLETDFDIAAQIPPRPNSLIELINKNSGRGSKIGRKHNRFGNNRSIFDNRSGKRGRINDWGDHGGRPRRGDRMTGGGRRRRRRTRWSAIDDNDRPYHRQHHNYRHHGGQRQGHATVSGVISDMLASHSPGRSITISQFKRYTEMSGRQPDIMNALTEAVLRQNCTAAVTGSDTHEKKSHSLSDKEIMEMIPMNEFQDLFEIEKIQLVLLYREALDKGIFQFPSHKKQTGSSSKQALLPTPKESSNGPLETHENASPVSSRKRHSSESSKSSNISCHSSVKSVWDTSDSDSGLASHKLPEKKQKIHKSSVKPSSPIKSEHSVNKNLNPTQTIESPPPVLSVSSNVPNSANIPSSTTDNSNTTATNSKSISIDNSKISDNIRYRDDINRLHALYSTMYHASLKMKDFENKIDSEDYQNSYKIYCDNYSEYQMLYSTLQSVINIDSINTDKPDSISNSCPGSEPAAPLVNGITATMSGVNQEQASSTISPALYAPDSTDSISENAKFNGTQSAQPQQQQKNLDLKTNLQNNLINFRQIKKEKIVESKKKFGYLWISNLSKEVRTNDICRAFGKFGHISKVKLFQYKAQIPPTHFGLVFMPNYNEAENACHQLQNKILLDRQIQIKMLENNPLSGDRLI